jgi:hypothetical protein
VFVSTRRRFRSGDPGWEAYTATVDLPPIAEVRSIDSALNRYAADAGDVECSPRTVDAALELLPAPASGEEYHLLALRLDADAGAAPDGWRLLGYDLSDETQTSSLLNCGPWEGPLRPFTRRLNGVGLLASAEDAAAAQRLLPQVWGADMDHARVFIWALYERADPPAHGA